MKNFPRNWWQVCIFCSWLSVMPIVSEERTGFAVLEHGSKILYFTIRSITLDFSKSTFATYQLQMYMVAMKAIRRSSIAAHLVAAYISSVGWNKFIMTPNVSVLRSWND